MATSKKHRTDLIKPISLQGMTTFDIESENETRLSRSTGLQINQFNLIDASS